MNQLALLKKLSSQSKFKFIVLAFLVITIALLMLFFSGSQLCFTIPTGTNAYKIWLARIQYVIKTLLSAGAIGLSNYLIQLFTKNKLADTSIMGINTFQQLAVAIFILLLPAFFMQYEQSYIFGFIYFGIGLFSGLIFYLISLKTNLTSRRIIIYGILLNVLITAIAYFLLSSDAINANIVKSRFIDYQNKVFGGMRLNNDFSGFYFACIVFIICFIWTLSLRFKIVAQACNPFKLASLGTNDSQIRLQLVLLISILGSVIFAIVGFVAFIGVSISFITSSLFKTFNQSVCGSILISCILMLVAQFVQIVISSTVASGISLTTIVGVTSFPIFIYFMLSKR